MLNAPAAVAVALEAAPQKGLSERRLVYVTVTDRATGDPVPIGAWTGDEDLTMQIISATTGLEETRTYYAMPALKVGEITCTTDMTVQSASIEMPQIADVVQALIRTHDARLARVEVHTLYLDVDTGQQLGTLVDWVGEVDKAPIRTPPVGEEGAATFRTVSDLMSMLTRINPRKSSYEGQKLRQGDEWGKYASTAGNWKLPWGQKNT
ncbi:hypothetical protein MZK49_07000 [Ensifer sesbaniae]|uniref:hypothetical protein n=1 Tax=Ensifer sesbaniae TaxID=1214071 RepID=UPI0020019B9B|nr:hypothetical protein [Ensifer sesbaniae]